MRGSSPRIVWGESSANIGIRVDLVGNFSGANAVGAPEMKLSLKGNSYLKHTEFEFDEDTGEIVDPWESIRVYTAYEQRIPTWLLADIGAEVGIFRTKHHSIQRHIQQPPRAIEQTIRRPTFPVYPLISSFIPHKLSES